ncbi:MAG: glutamine-hydrolyzing carbamoyl-phosphate synthase small subunit [Deferribacteraceae bacterium]|jgi:carbamoyl-phosphate synthase small subunit|nr:glutamine-hydrolyzing carbamoyl-phosphate synthase small subunit [Deferribacteraceae bacterium]
MRDKRAFLALEGGEVFRGFSCGAPVDALGEVVFITSMTGYQEVASDPSYAGQIVAFTAPEIGNYGANASDMESSNLFCNGLIFHELNPPSNFRSEYSFQELLKIHRTPAIAGVDVRTLTLLLRQKGTQKAFLHCSDIEAAETEGAARAAGWEGLDNQDYAAKVSTKEPYTFGDCALSLHAAVLDYGVKFNSLRLLESNGIRSTILPARSTAEDVLKVKPDGVFLSNGPADPAALKYAIETAKKLIGKVPLFGICLGHQLLGLACGADCGRLKFGHHGSNHPVKDLNSGAVLITSQNHNFALRKQSLPSSIELTHINLNDDTVEGIRHKSEPIFAVQYHPEAAPGPHDSAGLFSIFKQMMGRG